MARKQKAQPVFGPSPSQLRSRIQAQVREGRVPQALELARQLVQQEPIEPNRQLLRETWMAAVRQQVDRDAWTEARQLLDQAEKVEGPPAWWEQLALLRARAGDSTIARQLLEKVPGSTAAPRVLGHLVDRALRDPRNGKLKLAPDLHPGFDLVVTAFAHYEKGDDEAARQALQAIGLQSPYLDWKLLIRGLMAYALSDDARAQENWQRLDPERLPARLAAPFRFKIDSAYRGTLKPDQARSIGRRTDQVSHPMLGALRDLQKTLATAENLPKALGQAQSLVSMLKMNFPDLVPKVAHCFYWLIIQGGEPEDLRRYEKIFGPAADDKNFNRLEALVMESDSNLRSAHKCWQSYLAEIEQSPDRWPGEFGKRARATILMHMGDNALHHLEDDDDDLSFEDFLDQMISSPRRRKSRTQPLEPSAESCFRDAMKLAPDWKQPAQRLLHRLQETEKWVEAEAVSARLLDRFPDDVNVLMEVSTIYHQLGKTTEALELTRRALKINPLDRKLRAGVAKVTLQQARMRAVDGEFDEARAAYREAIDLCPIISATIGKPAWAACEYKAGNRAKAEELMAELKAKNGQRLAAAYFLAVECSRVKLARPLLKEFQARFQEVLATPASVIELMQLAQALSLYRQETPPYRGIGTHEKKIHALLQDAVETQLPEEALVELGFALLAFKASKILKLCASQGEQRFPMNPAFKFLSAEQLIMQRPKTFSAPNVGVMFRQVLNEVEGKSDERSRKMRDAIDERIKQFPQLELWVRGPSFMEFPW